MNQRPMFPHAVDSTMLAAFRSCPQKMLRTYVEHWKPQTESVHLVAGGAFAKGLEIARRAWYEGGIGDAEECVGLGLEALIKKYGDFECPADSAKSRERTAGALVFYFDQYPLGTDGMEPIRLADGRRGIEFSFAEPLEVRHPVTGNPILYTGRSDLICEYLGGRYIEDDKTATSLGPTWSRQWEMRGQFTGYIWAAARAGIATDGAIIRGVSILKTKYDTQQAITYRTPWEVDRWLEQTHRDIERMKKCWEAGWWDYALDGACAEYGGCSMLSVCKSATPEDWLPVKFEKRVWDPLARRELSVAEWEASWDHDGTYTPVPEPEEGFAHHPQPASGAEGASIEELQEMLRNRR